MRPDARAEVVPSAASDGAELLTPEQLRAWRAYFDSSRDVFVSIERSLRQALGISVADNEMLEPLLDADPDGLRAGELAETSGWHTARVAHQVRRMEERGLLIRVPHPDDRRGTVVRLTDSGRDIALKAVPIVHGSVRKLLVEAMSDADFLGLGERSRLILDRMQTLDSGAQRTD
jgi:DNA-binding MarR family transcriptional regulator